MTKKDSNEQEETKLVWSMKDLPDANGVAKLVEQKVITPEEAKSILFKEEVKKSEEVEALKEMVQTLQGLVKDLLKRGNIQYVPWTQVIEVPRRQKPYWDAYWVNSTSGSPITTTAGSTSGSTTTYTLSM